MAKDPVCGICGMQVNEKSSPSVMHGGQKYYFCCDGCKATFEKDPANFVGKQSAEPSHGHAGH
ncbi:MAG: YHS domain-containing protein [Dehalococcoidia bacterium]|nr:YHS domain-containing protein [Dehalococcoidia bacterium]